MFEFTQKDLVKAYGDCEGPLGFPMMSEQAKLLEKAMSEQPEDCRTTFDDDDRDGYLRKALVSENQDTDSNERTDKSIITNSVLDRYMHIVETKGIDTSSFMLNPQVPFEHMYKALPVGRSLWLTAQKSRTPEKNGIVAKTQYHKHTFAENVWALIESGALPGKSVGLLPMSVRGLNEKEIKARPELAEHASRILVIDKSVLLEYSVAVIPVNPTTLTTGIKKSLSMDGMLDTVEMIRKAGVAIPKNVLDEGEAEVEEKSGVDDRVVILSVHEPVNMQVEIEKAVKREFGRLTGKMFS